MAITMLRNAIYSGFGAVCFGVFTACSVFAQTANAPQPGLPGGATSLQETFNDWMVSCAVQGNVKACSIMQQQNNQQTRQRVLAIELSTAGDKVEGAILLPFGLLLDRGVVLQIDEQPAQPTLKFKTCVPGGCMIAVNFDAKTIASLRAGTVLKAKVAVDGGPDQVLPISLKGLGQALDRIVSLMKS